MTTGKEKKIELLREKAHDILKKDSAGYAMRSCWNCNPAHEHLKKADCPILCSECGHWYFRGYDITVKDTK